LSAMQRNATAMKLKPTSMHLINILYFLSCSCAVRARRWIAATAFEDFKECPRERRTNRRLSAHRSNTIHYFTILIPCSALAPLLILSLTTTSSGL
jgi:hypothetical protein